MLKSLHLQLCIFTVSRYQIYRSDFSLGFENFEFQFGSQKSAINEKLVTFNMHLETVTPKLFSIHFLSLGTKTNFNI